jgi:hypothetical protein
MQHFIGCDVHTRNQVVARIEEETGEIKKRHWSTRARKCGSFTRSCVEGRWWGSKQRFQRTGLSGCWRSWGTSCGWGTRRAFEPQGTVEVGYMVAHW